LETLVRYSLTLGAAAALLAGCGAAQSLSADPVPGAGTALQRLAHVGSWVKPNSSGQNLIYMASGSEVDMYTFAGKQVGALKGLNGVSGLCSDTQGNVWVTYGASLLEYAHAGTIPIAQLYTPSGPYGCAVDPTTNDIAVAENGEGSGSNNVAVFTDIYGTPQVYTDPDFRTYNYCSYDGAGNLYVNGEQGKRVPIAELASGGNALQTIPTDEKFEKLGGLQWYDQYLAVGDSEKHVVYSFSIADGKATTQSTTHFKGWIGRDFKSPQPFAIYNGEIVLTFSKRQTGIWKFPAGGGSIRRINVVTGAKTISVAPSARVRR
jgi:hypothetical protein